MTVTHFHLKRYEDDENPPEIFPDVYSALGYAAEILSDLADQRISGVSYVAGRHAEGENVGEGEALDALQDYFEYEKYENLSQNARTRAGNRLQAVSDRPPLFSDPSDAGNSFEDNDPRSNLYQSATWVMGLVNAESPVSIWECEAQTEEIDDPGSVDYGMMYCANDLAEEN